MRLLALLSFISVFLLSVSMASAAQQTFIFDTLFTKNVSFWSDVNASISCTNITGAATNLCTITAGGGSGVNFFMANGSAFVQINESASGGASNLYVEGYGNFTSVNTSTIEGFFGDACGPGEKIIDIADDGTFTCSGDLGNTTEEIQDASGSMVTSNTEEGITVTYQDGDGTLDFQLDFGDNFLGWANITDATFPSACTAAQTITGISDTITCSAIEITASQVSDFVSQVQSTIDSYVNELFVRNLGFYNSTRANEVFLNSSNSSPYIPYDEGNSQFYNSSNPDGFIDNSFNQTYQDHIDNDADTSTTNEVPLAGTMIDVNSRVVSVVIPDCSAGEVLTNTSGTITCVSDQTSSGGGENFWMDNGTFIQPNGSFADDVFVEILNASQIFSGDWSNVSIGTSQITDLNPDTNASTGCTGFQFLSGDNDCVDGSSLVNTTAEMQTAVLTNASPYVPFNEGNAQFYNQTNPSGFVDGDFKTNVAFTNETNTFSLFQNFTSGFDSVGRVNFTDGPFVNDTRLLNVSALFAGDVSGLFGNLQLGSGVVSDAEVSSLSWSELNNYPSACGADETITSIGDTITCTAIAIATSAITDWPTALWSLTNPVYANQSDVVNVTTSFGGEVSGTYDNVVLGNNALDDQYIELGDAFGGDVSGTYDAISVDSTKCANDELLDGNGDCSAFSNFQDDTPDDDSEVPDDITIDSSGKNVTTDSFFVPKKNGMTNVSMYVNGSGCLIIGFDDGGPVDYWCK